MLQHILIPMAYENIYGIHGPLHMLLSILLLFVFYYHTTHAYTKWVKQSIWSVCGFACPVKKCGNQHIYRPLAQTIYGKLISLLPLLQNYCMCSPCSSSVNDASIFAKMCSQSKLKEGERCGTVSCSIECT